MNTTYIRLALRDREEISRGIYAHESFAEIARRIHRPTSTISEEVWNNTEYSWCYSAEKAQERSDKLKKKGAIHDVVVDSPRCGKLKDQKIRNQKTQEFKYLRDYCETNPDAEP